MWIGARRVIYLWSLFGMQLQLNIAEICFHQYALWQRATGPLSFRQKWRLGLEELFEERHYIFSVSVV